MLISCWIGITAFFGYQLQYLSADFEFEKFFPSTDPDIAFYETHLEHFSYDNDYLILILESSTGIFQQPFLEAAAQLSDSLVQIKGIAQVASPTQLQHLIQGPLGITALPIVHTKEPQKYPADSLKAFEHPIFSAFFGRDGKSMLIQITHNHLETPEAASVLLGQIEGLLHQFEFEHYRIAGKLMAQEAFTGYIQSDFVLFLSAALVVGFLLLLLVFRSFKVALFPYMVSLTSLIWLLGLMALLGHKITILGALIPPVILFVSSSDAVHLVNAFKGSAGPDFITRLQQAVQRVFIPTFLTSITTAIGFFSLIALDTEPIRHLGIFCGIGVLIAFVTTFGFGPLLIRKNQYPTTGHFGFRGYTVWVLRHAKLIFAASSILVVASLIGITQLRTDAYLLQDLPEGSTVRQDFTFVDQYYGGSKPWEMAYWPTDPKASVWDEQVMKEAGEIHNYLSSEYPIERLWSPIKLMKYGHQIINGGVSGAYELPDPVAYPKTLRVVRQYTQRAAAPPLVTADGKYARMVGYIPEFGSSETISRNHQLIEFLDREIDPDILQYRLTGTTFLIDKSHELLSANLMKGLMLAIGIISLVLAFYFRSLKILAISLVPNIIPLLVTAGFMGAAGISLQLTTSIIFAVSFGIAVDDTIHFIASYRRMQGSNRVYRLIRTFQAAGRAILVTTMVIISGFMLFIFSSFGATFYLGLFLSISLVVALIIDLTLLPLLLHYSQNK